MTKSVLIKLSQPIEANGIEVKELSMRAPLVRDMLNGTKSADSNEEKEIHLFANLCNVSPKDIELLAPSDYFKLQAKYNDFLS